MSEKHNTQNNIPNKIDLPIPHNSTIINERSIQDERLSKDVDEFFNKLQIVVDDNREIFSEKSINTVITEVNGMKKKTENYLANIAKDEQSIDIDGTKEELKGILNRLIQLSTLSYSIRHQLPSPDEELVDGIIHGQMIHHLGNSMITYGADLTLDKAKFILSDLFFSSEDKQDTSYEDLKWVINEVNKLIREYPIQAFKDTAYHLHVLQSLLTHKTDILTNHGVIEYEYYTNPFQTILADLGEGSRVRSERVALSLEQGTGPIDEIEKFYGINFYKLRKQVINHNRSPVEIANELAQKKIEETKILQQDWEKVFNRANELELLPYYKQAKHKNE